jgi:hypothetical protein
MIALVCTFETLIVRSGSHSKHQLRCLLENVTASFGNQKQGKKNQERLARMFLGYVESRKFPLKLLGDSQRIGKTGIAILSGILRA